MPVPRRKRNRSSLPRTRRTLTRRALLLPVVSLAAFTTTAPPAAAETPPMPAVRAYDQGKPLSSYEPVLRHCARAGCSFHIQPDGNREYTTAVRPVGNAILNCTNADITTRRTVTLETSSTDNIGGGISESSRTEDGISAVTQISSNGNNVVLGATAAFQQAYQATWSHQWVSRHTEVTEYTITVKPHDMVVFNAANAMTRTKGRLGDDRGAMYADEVTVDSPSTTNPSIVQAQSFAAHDRCANVRSQGGAARGVTADPDGLLLIAPPPSGTKPSSWLTLTPERRRVFDS
ncbi:hypothetical protein [Streptomyces sp. NPDC053048]|uniref:hypothetical protein n=1 Tax=Streptomyces sp. NPDC053048 TaxID=3365694 RepID=UPI0037CEB144